MLRQDNIYKTTVKNASPFKKGYYLITNYHLDKRVSWKWVKIKYPKTSIGGKGLKDQEVH